MKLTDSQLILLSRASQRADRCAEIPGNLKGGVAQKFIATLLDGGLAEEIRAEPEMPAWRKGESGAFALRVTDAGLSAISANDVAPPSAGIAALATTDGTPSPTKRKPVRKSSQLKPEDRRPGPEPKVRREPEGLVKAGHRDRAAEPGSGRHHRRHHEGDRLAGAFGARLLRGRGAQEAWPEPCIGGTWRRTRLPHRIGSAKAERSTGKTKG